MEATNLSKLKRNEMIGFLEHLKEKNNDDKSIRAINEIVNQLNSTKYGLVWEQHKERVDVELEKNIPIFSEIEDKKICVNQSLEYNFLIEGDNLHSLYLLEKTHREKIDVIYIDPPYNTGNEDFVYNDNYVDSEDGYKHSKWLSFMEKRLKIAKNLLSNTGIIFISINNYEQSQLKLLCDEIFGEQNFIECAVVKISENGKGDKKGFANNHDFLLCYQKSSDSEFNGLSMNEEYINKFDHEDEYGKYKMDGILMKKGADSRREDSPTLYYPLYFNPETGKVSLEKNEDTYKERYPYKSDGTDGRWTWSKNKVKEEAYRLYASPNATIYIKDYYSENRRMKIKSILEETSYLNNIATNETTQIYGKRDVFDTPKPIKLIKDLIDIASKKDSIVLDFFAGSGTTGQAVLELNNEDNGNRKFILCTDNFVSLDKKINYFISKKMIGKEPRKKTNAHIEWENKINEITDSKDFKELKETNEYKNLGICRSACYPRLKTVITGKTLDNKEYRVKIPSNLKYYVTSWTPRKPEDYLLSNVLLLHIKEMIELQNTIEIDNKKNIIIFNKDDYKKFILNEDIYNGIKNIWVNQNIVFTSEELKRLSSKGFKYIPKEFFGQELKEAAE